MSSCCACERQIPLDDLGDVIVIGGGPAGCAAGTAAAMAAQNDPINVHVIDTNALRERLRDKGTYLPGT